MNHNAYYIKNSVDTAYRNIESYFNICTTSVVDIKGFLEVGDAKNIIVEDYDDNVESQILLPADGVIVYKDVDFSIKLLIEGNTSYKVTEQMNRIIAYFEKSPVTIKDNYRMHGNKIVLLGWQQNTPNQLSNGTPKANELLLLNLKFKKIFSSDIPFLNVVSNTFEDDHTPQTTSIELVWVYVFPSIASNLFVEQGFYIKKSTDSTYVKHVTSNLHLSFITEVVTGLTTATTYNVYPFVTTKLETIVGAVENITTL